MADLNIVDKFKIILAKENIKSAIFHIFLIFLMLLAVLIVGFPGTLITSQVCVNDSYLAQYTYDSASPNANLSVIYLPCEEECKDNICVTTLQKNNNGLISYVLLFLVSSALLIFAMLSNNQLIKIFNYFAFLFLMIGGYIANSDLFSKWITGKMDAVSSVLSVIIFAILMFVLFKAILFVVSALKKSEESFEEE